MTGPLPAPPIDREFLVRTAWRLVAAASPTLHAGPALDELAGVLREQGIEADRPTGGHPSAPAVAAWIGSRGTGPVLQFNAHLDVVHLPFVPPTIDGNLLRGSGAADMKGGAAAATAALVALHKAGLPRRGSVLLTAHDCHEAPWGDGRQLEALIDEGLVGDAVLIPEPLCDRLPVRGRGQACWKITLGRPGPPVHEVMHPPDESLVLPALAALAVELEALDARLRVQIDPIAGRSSLFIGQIHGGSLFNQSVQSAWLEGTRRWIPGHTGAEAEHEMRALIDDFAKRSGLAVDLSFRVVREAFFLDEHARIVSDFQAAVAAHGGNALASGPKPFVDDGNTFASKARVPAITHGPRASGQHTTDEWADMDDMLRVARVYAETAVRFLEAD